MKAKHVIIALAGIVLMANEASASQQPHVRHMMRVFGQTYGRVSSEALQDQLSRNKYQSMYESYSLDHQSFPNPDREFTGSKNPL